MHRGRLPDVAGRLPFARFRLVTFARTRAIASAALMLGVRVLALVRRLVVVPVPVLRVLRRARPAPAAAVDLVRTLSQQHKQLRVHARSEQQNRARTSDMRYTALRCTGGKVRFAVGPALSHDVARPVSALMAHGRPQQLSRQQPHPMPCPNSYFRQQLRLQRSAQSSY